MGFEQSASPHWSGRSQPGCAGPVHRWSVLCACVLLSACSAGYQGAVSSLHAAIDAGDTDGALLAANQALGVERAEQLPGDVGGDAPLLLLERAALLQSMGKHERASRDFAAADKSMEVLDFTEDDAGSVGQYLFSDDATVYKAPPHEKLLVNTLGMISYLARGDLQGAKVEARRLTVLQKYFTDAAPEELTLFGLGSYLAGFAFEKDGNLDEALRYYLEAFHQGENPGLKRQLAYLGPATGFQDDAIAQAAEELGDVGPPQQGEGEILVVIQNGRAPYKVAERFPIGAFLVLPVADSRYAMTPQQRQEADRLIASGLFKWINFPVLKGVEPRYRHLSLTVGGSRASGPEIGLNVAEATIAAWEHDKGRFMLAAFTRMLARALAAEATTAVGKGAGLDKQLFPGASWLLGRALEGGLTAADTPDTRSWTMLPGSVEVYRVRVPAGTHDVVVRPGGGGRSHRQQVEVGPGGFAVVSARFL